MKTPKPITLLTVLTAILTTCNTNTQNDNIQTTLSLAKNNRQELEKAIKHYSQNPADSLKLKTINFLVANMAGHYFYKGRQLNAYNQIFDIIEKREKLNPYKGNNDFPETDQMWDSISRIHRPLNIRRLEIVNDYEVITANLLIENIEYAFKAWEMPWAKHLTFQQFCEYILPYRFHDEHLESWRPKFMEMYSWLIDSIKDKQDPVEACKIINDDISKWFRFNGLFNKYPGAISPGNIMKAKMGKCLDQAGVANYTMRAMGVPVVHEFIPQWGDRGMGHDFSAILGRDNKFIDFLGGDKPPGKNKLGNMPPKIFRSTFARQHNPLLSGIGNIEDIPPKLRSPFFKDVTKEYIAVSDIEVKLTQTPPQGAKYVYLCVFNNRDWIPIFWGELEHGRAIFKNMGRNIVYLPAFYQGNQVIPAASPILLDSLGKTTIIKASTQQQAVIPKRKFPLTELKRWWMTLMGDGIFQAANKPNFSDAVDLYTIPGKIDLILHKKSVNNIGKYRYVRYLFPKDCFASLGEIAFFGKERENETILNGIKIKSKKVKQKDLEIAFDGKYNKFIHTQEKGSYNGLWIGLDLGKKKSITKVGFCPRTDENNIYKGMTYELLYWGNGWESLGIKIAGGNELIYDNVPAGALLLLRNHTEGKEERIFTWENGRQVWW